LPDGYRSNERDYRLGEIFVGIRSTDPATVGKGFISTCQKE
jgi:hypothetical protein